MAVSEFNELLLNNADPLRPIAMNLTHDQETAKDLFQETLFRALMNRDKYQTGTNIKAWLFTIMRNVFINNYRRQVKRRMIFGNRSTEVITEYRNVIVINEGENLLRFKEFLQAVYMLPQIFRTPFLLYFEGYRYHEISESLNEPLGTIKSRIHFARKLLKDQISRH